MEAKIWLLGSGEGVKKVLAEANLGKEVTVSRSHRSESSCVEQRTCDRPRQLSINPPLPPLPQEILSACWSSEVDARPTFTQLADMLEKLPKLNRRLSHPGHFWKTAEYVT